ncbi:MAG: penicillin-binding protein activator [Alphaproteobacteria bacterium]|nr:penicillin-binding protein activator [Alphaproteobacteria bacterium]
MKRFIWVAALMFLSACTGYEPVFFQDGSVVTSEAKRSVPTVSVLLPLSGESAEVGQALQKTALLSLFEHSSVPFKLLFFDTQSSAEGAVQAYNWALAQKPNVILGPVFSAEVEAITKAGMPQPMLTFTSDTTVVRPDAATLAVLVPDQLQKLVRYACDQGQYHLAVLSPENKTGEIAMNALDEAIKICPGMALTKVSLYDGNTMNFTPAVLSILPKIYKDKGQLTEKEKILANTPMKDRIDFDALFVLESGVKLRQLASLLNFYDISPHQIPVYGLTSVKQVQDKVVNGIVFADVEDAGYSAFAREYRHYFGKSPMRLTSLMYDALNMIFERLNEGLSMDDLRHIPYQGVDGLVSLQENGTNRRALQLVTKLGNQTIVVQPTRFSNDGYEP